MAPVAPVELPSPPPITDRIALGADQHIPARPGRPGHRADRPGRAAPPAPARVVVYWVLALALYGLAAHEEVLRWLVEGLGWGGADQVFDRQV